MWATEGDAAGGREVGGAGTGGGHNIRHLTRSEIVDRARNRVPGYMTLMKSLAEGRFAK